MRRFSAFVASIVLLVSVGALGGCSLPDVAGGGSADSAAVTLTPKTTATNKAGVLTVGVDYTSAPFAGTDSNGNVVGVDVDVAAAVAEQLGCTVEFVDVPGDSADSALQAGTVDCVMNVSAWDFPDTSVTTVGPYLVDGPAVFSTDSVAQEATRDMTAGSASFDVPGASIVSSQQGSASLNEAKSAYPLAQVVETATLSEAFDDLEAGTSSYVAADAVVGSYIAQNYDDVSYIATISSTTGLYIGVAPTNMELAGDLNGALNAIQSNGVLSVALSKWTGGTLTLPDPVDAATYQTGNEAAPAPRYAASAAGTAASMLGTTSDASTSAAGAASGAQAASTTTTSGPAASASATAAN